MCIHYWKTWCWLPQTAPTWFWLYNIPEWTFMVASFKWVGFVVANFRRKAVSFCFGALCHKGPFRKCNVAGKRKLVPMGTGGRAGGGCLAVIYAFSMNSWFPFIGGRVRAYIYGAYISRPLSVHSLSITWLLQWLLVESSNMSARSHCAGGFSY